MTTAMWLRCAIIGILLLEWVVWWGAGSPPLDPD